jgi:hypothetical protein
MRDVSDFLAGGPKGSVRVKMVVGGSSNEVDPVNLWRYLVDTAVFLARKSRMPPNWPRSSIIPSTSPANHLRDPAQKLAIENGFAEARKTLSARAQSISAEHQKAEGEKRLDTTLFDKDNWALLREELIDFIAHGIALGKLSKAQVYAIAYGIVAAYDPPSTATPSSTKILALINNNLDSLTSADDSSSVVPSEVREEFTKTTSNIARLKRQQATAMQNSSARWSASSLFATAANARDTLSPELTRETLKRQELLRRYPALGMTIV